MRLQGKRNRGKEEVKFLEIKGDEQLSGNQQWMTKNMSEEKQQRQSFSKVMKWLDFLKKKKIICVLFFPRSVIMGRQLVLTAKAGCACNSSSMFSVPLDWEHLGLPSFSLLLLCFCRGEGSSQLDNSGASIRSHISFTRSVVLWKGWIGCGKK